MPLALPDRPRPSARPHAELRTPLLAALTLCGLAPAALAVQDWQPQVPAPQPRLDAVHLRSAFDAWTAGSAGDDGFAQHTTNGGATFSEVSLPGTPVRGVHFLSGGVGLVAGAGLHRTTDNGATWFEVNATPGLVDVHFADGTTGHACGPSGLVLRTTNGGASWQSAGPVGVPVDLARVVLVDAQRGWAVGDGGTILHTSDGAQSWTAQTSQTAADLAALDFVSATEGWAGGDGVVVRTSDGGASWTPTAFPAGGAVDALSALTALRAFTVGADGAVRETTDGGATWTTRFTTGGLALHDIDHGDFFSAMAVGEAGAVFETTDGGASWQQIAGGSVATVPEFRGLDAVDDQRGWAASISSGIWRTTDGGADWQVSPIDPLLQVYDVAFADDGLHGFACGTRQGTFPAMAWSNDGGLSWNSTYQVANFRLYTAAAADAQTAVVAGDTHVLRTTDGGQSWGYLSPPSPFSTFHGSDFATATQGWLVGTTIQRTLDGGASWTFQHSPLSTLRAVSFADATTGWAVGDGGLVLRTTDAGVTWTPQDAGAAPRDLHGVRAVDASEAWIAGADGFVASTTDGGATWQTESVPGLGAATIRAIDVVAGGAGWIAGSTPMGVWRRESTACLVESYCSAKTNSAGGQVALTWSGPPSAAVGVFTLTANGGLPNKPGLFFHGDAGPAATPLLGGTLCVAGSLQREGVLTFDAFGTLVQPLVVTSDLADTTRWYQLWYRDPAHPDGTGSGLSGGVEVHFCP